jgi:hypothetical protein
MTKPRNSQPNWNKRTPKRRRPRVDRGTRRDGPIRAETASSGRVDTTRLR